MSEEEQVMIAIKNELARQAKLIEEMGEDAFRKMQRDTLIEENNASEKKWKEEAKMKFEKEYDDFTVFCRRKFCNETSLERDGMSVPEIIDVLDNTIQRFNWSCEENTIIISKQKAAKAKRRVDMAECYVDLIEEFNRDPNAKPEKREKMSSFMKLPLVLTLMIKVHSKRKTMSTLTQPAWLQTTYIQIGNGHLHPEKHFSKS